MHPGCCAFLFALADHLYSVLYTISGGVGKKVEGKKLQFCDDGSKCPTEEIIMCKLILIFPCNSQERDISRAQFCTFGQK